MRANYCILTVSPPSPILRVRESFFLKAFRRPSDDCTQESIRRGAIMIARPVKRTAYICFLVLFLLTMLAVLSAPAQQSRSVAYIADQTLNAVLVINTQTGQPMAHIKVGSVPLGVALSPDGARLYVANTSS